MMARLESKPDYIDEGDGFFADAAADPAYKFIVDAAMGAHRLGFDLADPDVRAKVIVAGHRAHERAGKPTRYKTEPRPTVLEQSHQPVVYYMRLGDLVKIGTTANLGARYAAINPEGLMALEFGGRRLERQRHNQFSICHHHGEWFRLGPMLAMHIVGVRADFETAEGMTTEEWAAPRIADGRRGR